MNCATNLRTRYIHIRVYPITNYYLEVSAVWLTLAGIAQYTECSIFNQSTLITKANLKHPVVHRQIAFALDFNTSKSVCIANVGIIR